jgi:hypothetical protein
MGLADEIGKLQELRESGALTDEEFARAKAAVLASGSLQANQPDDAPLQRHLQHIEIQNEIERLDREWELEREKYMATGRYGSRHVPSEGGSIVAALIIGGFGLFWTIGAASMGAPAIFPIFGIVFVVLGVGASLSGFTKAGEYQHAYREYQERRARLLAQSDKQRRR